MNWIDKKHLKGSAAHVQGSSKLGWFMLVLSSALTASIPVSAQQKTGPSITNDDALTFHGVTLYGVIDVGLQYDTHGAPFSDFRPAASANIVQKNSRQSVFGVTPSNMGQSRVGLQGDEPLYGDWSAVFRIETFFNPQSGQIADALKSLTVNNGRTPANSGTNLDGSSAGQAFQTAFVGLSSKQFGTITFGRQLTLLTEGTIKYDPNYDASAFGLIGASGSYQGGGTTEDKRLDSMLKYYATFDDLVHVGALYKFNGSTGGANTAFQAVLGAQYAGASVDAYYSKERDAISAASLTSAQVAELPGLGYSVTNSVSATVSDDTAYALMGLYTIDPLKFGGYVLAFVTNNAYDIAKTLNVYWTGVRYTVIPHLDLTAAYYGYRQNAYASGSEAGCTTAVNAACSGSFDAYSFDADYFFNKHFDAYGGAMYSGVHDGVASGYAYHTTNINPTIGVRYKF